MMKFWHLSKSSIAVLLGLLLTGSLNLSKAAAVEPPAVTIERPTGPAATVVYTPTSADFPNPERGLYLMEETFASAHTPLELSTLQYYRQQQNITLVLRVFYLDSFRTGPISANYLTAIQTDFTTARQAGLKLIVRFAYNQTALSPNPDEPSLAQMLAHLDQLQPVLQANSDVIAVVQAGFIGAWGEWYYTNNDFGTPPNPPHYPNRRTLLQKILTTLPVTRMVQIRTPAYKQNIFNTPNGAGGAISDTIAYNGSDLARVAHHNDCFLAGEDDMGTYTDPAQDYPYLAAETRYLAMGGETCLVNPPRSDWATAAQELALFHWSYLHLGYHADVLSSWGNHLTDTVRLKLGYRFVLLAGTYSDVVFPGGQFHLTLTLKNEGWAAPYNPRRVELILRNTTTGNVYPFALPADPRWWLPGGATYTLDHWVALPQNLPPGNYALLLHLPDPVPSLSARPDYAIQLANNNLWEPTTGYNKLLHTLTVNAPIPAEWPRVFLPVIRR